jgi:soluble lytic murein transglycosylase
MIAAAWPAHVRGEEKKAQPASKTTAAAKKSATAKADAQAKKAPATKGTAAAKDKSPAKSKAAAKKPAPAASKSKAAQPLNLTGKPQQAATAAKKPPVPLPRPRPVPVAPKIAAAVPGATAALPYAATNTPALAALPPQPQSPAAPLAAAPTLTTSAEDLAAVKNAIALARKGSPNEATGVQNTISDPLARKLVEWVILRSDDNNATFARYAAFIAANSGWPGIVTMRRRAEAMLWFERPSPQVVRAFFAHEKPRSVRGHFALARAMMAQGDRAGAQRLVRTAWREEYFTRDLEDSARETFGDLITRADVKARMDFRLYAEDIDTATRMAKRLGGHEPAIVKARAAVINKAKNAKALLDAVPTEARHDAGYIFSRIQWLRRQDKIAEAGQLMLAAPRDPAQLHDLDEWWVERRLLARKLLDIGDAKTAYLIARDAAHPVKENFRGEHPFTAGWIALRFLNNPSAALPHFARIGHGTSNPITLARASYWQGRAAEAMGRQQEARAHYQQSARYPTAYYGQIARARLGLSEMTLRTLPDLAGAQRTAPARLEVTRAAEILYAVGARDLAASFLADFGDKSPDAHAIAALAEVATRNADARAALLAAKFALNRGHALDHHAFPTFGVPDYQPIGPKVETSLVYSIVRQESAFNPRVVSSAKALGLMQVMPATGKYLAKKFNVPFDQKRLLNDTVYNTQMGAAELGEVVEWYRGSYILAFAAYNAGRGRVKEWIERYGDPRDPKVDPIDWVERIPFSETRNYVQRVMENVQVYRVRFSAGSKLLIEADLRRGAVVN